MRIRFLVFALILGMIAAGCGGGEEIIPLPDSTPFAPEVMEQVHEIRDLAAKARGLDPVEDITEGTITRDQLKAYYDEINRVSHESDSDGELEVWNTALRLVQFLEPGQDMLEEYTGDLGEGVIGFYSLEDDALVMVDDGEGVDPSLDIEDSASIAHEYIHSFQDASFDFDKLDKLQEKEEKDDLNTEYYMTIDALMEGDAQAASIDYLGLKLGPDGFKEWLRSVDSGDSDMEDEEETALDRQTMFPYTEGMTFVMHLWSNGGWDEVNEAYNDPPKTTEQIMHPERYDEGDEPLGLTLPDLSHKLGKGWEQSDDSLFGEFDVYNYIRTRMDDDDNARSVADGWHGGRIAIYDNNEDPNRVLVHMVLAWDDEQQAIEFHRAFQLHLKAIEDQPRDPRVWASSDMQTWRVYWDGADEHVYSWMEGEVFHALFAVQQDDLDQAVSIVNPGVSRENISADVESE